MKGVVSTRVVCVEHLTSAFLNSGAPKDRRPSNATDFFRNAASRPATGHSIDEMRTYSIGNALGCLLGLKGPIHPNQPTVMPRRGGNLPLAAAGKPCEAECACARTASPSSVREDGQILFVDRLAELMKIKDDGVQLVMWRQQSPPTFIEVMSAFAH